MRAALIAILLLAPLSLAASPAPQGDLIVTLHERASFDPPAGALLLHVLDGFILPDATRADAARLASDPRVARLDWAVPLEFHAIGSPALPSRAHHALTRADAPGPAGASVTVAVLDSGIDMAHPDLAGRVKENQRLVSGRFVPSPGDPDGHGTHVAGIVAASHDRWPGVAPRAELVGIDISERFSTSGAVAAYDWLYQNHERLGIRVVVNAWGRVDEKDHFDAGDPAIRAIDRLVAAGVVVLFSASNHGPGPGTLSIEAMDPRVITVGATDAAGQLMSFSSRGPVVLADPRALAWTKPDVVAPGDLVVGPRSAALPARADDPDALHTTYSGTSQAVPHVAGIVARMLSARPDLTPEEVAVALRASAVDLAPAGPDDATGWGVVDAVDALRLVQGLSAQRGNVLIAGGVDTIQDTSELVATPRRGLLDLVTRPQVVWETPFVVKAGATRLSVDAYAQGAQDLTIELAHNGRLAGGTDIEDPAPGLWLLRMRATVPTATQAGATFTTQMPAAPERALQSDGRQTAPVPAPIGDAPAALASGDAFLLRFWAPLALWAASGGLLGYAVMPRRR